MLTQETRDHSVTYMKYLGGEISYIQSVRRGRGGRRSPLRGHPLPGRRPPPPFRGPPETRDHSVTYMKYLGGEISYMDVYHDDDRSRST